MESLRIGYEAAPPRLCSRKRDRVAKLREFRNIYSLFLPVRVLRNSRSFATGRGDFQLSPDRLASDILGRLEASPHRPHYRGLS